MRAENALSAESSRAAAEYVRKCAATENAPCRFPRMARPAFHSVGIDVFKTVRGFGLPICTLEHPETEAQNWYSAVFVE